MKSYAAVKCECGRLVEFDESDWANEVDRLREALDILLAPYPHQTDENTVALHFPRDSYARAATLALSSRSDQT